MTSNILEVAVGMHSSANNANMASEAVETTVKKEAYYDTVRQTLREAIR